MVERADKLKNGYIRVHGENGARAGLSQSAALFPLPFPPFSPSLSLSSLSFPLLSLPSLPLPTRNIHSSRVHGKGLYSFSWESHQRATYFEDVTNGQFSKN